MHCSYITQVTPIYSRDSAWTVSNLQDDKLDGIADSISVKLEALAPGLFERGVQTRSRESWTD